MGRIRHSKGASSSGYRELSRLGRAQSRNWDLVRSRNVISAPSRRARPRGAARSRSGRRAVCSTGTGGARSQSVSSAELLKVRNLRCARGVDESVASAGNARGDECRALIHRGGRALSSQCEFGSVCRGQLVAVEAGVAVRAGVGCATRAAHGLVTTLIVCAACGGLAPGRIGVARGSERRTPTASGQ